MWNSKVTSAISRVTGFADYVVASRGFNSSNATLDQLENERLKALNDISLSLHNVGGEYVITDDEIREYHEKYTGKRQ